MSTITVDRAFYRLRQLINDTDMTAPGASLPRYMEVMDRAWMWVSAQTSGHNVQFNGSFLPLVPGQFRYQSGSFTETSIETFNSFRLTATGLPVQRVPINTLMKFRTGNTSATADPLLISFLEADDGTLEAWVWPTPSRVTVIEATRDVASLPLFEGLANQDLTTINFNLGVYALEAFIYKAAALLVSSFSPQKVTQMGLNPGFAMRGKLIGAYWQTLEQLAEGMIVQEKQRYARQRQNGLSGFAPLSWYPPIG